MNKKIVIISVCSFILGYFCSTSHKGNLVLESQDIYFGDSPSYSLNKNGYDIFLVILIFSSLNNFHRRDIIRNTWLSDIKDNKEIKYFFAISAGMATEQQKSNLYFEQNEHNDLLIFPNLDDSFYLLTSKLIASFGWLMNISVLESEGKSSVKNRIRKFQYLLKCDDDSFVRVSDIVNELKSNFANKKGDNLYWGFFDGRASPRKAGKWKESEWRICDYYIPYALGGGYVLAYPLVNFIARNGNFLQRYVNEDVSVGAWLSSYADLNRVHDPRFDTEYISRGCHQSYLITHKHTDIALRNFHNNLKNNGNLCEKEFRTRISYNYNWNVLPSKCCVRNNPNIP